MLPAGLETYRFSTPFPSPSGIREKVFESARRKAVCASLAPPLRSVLPAGLEPAIAVPKTDVISISLREQANTSYSMWWKAERYTTINPMKNLGKIKIPFIPEEVSAVGNTLHKAGFEAYLVGGCVRDMLLSLKPRDWDYTTNATPEEIIKLFPKTFYENEYGTVGIVNETTADESLKIVEVTPYRLEAAYSNKRHPDSVTFGRKIEEDLKRRDFTINAIALKTESEASKDKKVTLLDPYGGQADLERKLIKTVGNPNDRFSEDALRILRAIRLSSELNFAIETETTKGITDNASLLKKISFERIRDEFIRIIMSPNPMSGLILSHKLGVLPFIIPELVESLGVNQNQAHTYDVFEHLLRTLQHAADKNWTLEVRLAALLHDIGKPKSRRWLEEKKDWTFYGHDVIGAKMAAEILARLKFPKETIDTVVKLVRWHMFFSDTELITLSSVRRMIHNVGKELIWDLMNLRACDRIGTGRPKETPYRLRKYKSMVEEALHDPVSVGMLHINGQKVMEVTELPPGPKIGHILHALLEEVFEDPKKNEETHLIKRAQEFAQMSEKELEKIGNQAKEKKEEEEGKILKSIRDKYWVK